MENGRIDGDVFAPVHTVIVAKLGGHLERLDSEVAMFDFDPRDHDSCYDERHSKAPGRGSGAGGGKPWQADY